MRSRERLHERTVPAHDVIVLAGGSAKRLGGLHKPAQYVGPLTLLDRVLQAVPDAGRVVCVGPDQPTAREVTWTREDPAGSGPVAALARGLALVTAPTVVLLAADLPFLTRPVVDTLLLQANAVLVDQEGRDQFLISAWRTADLRAADLSVDRLGAVVRQVGATRVAWPGAPGVPAPWTDCDTPADLEAAREAV